MTDLELRCACGCVTGRARRVDPAEVNRVICHCRGCRSYAELVGESTTMLDAHGGTELFHVSPRCLEITAGTQHLACMRLTRRGARRWYAACCRTPLANTLPSMRLPFVAIHPRCVLWPGHPPREQLLGPVRARVNGRFSGQQAAELGATRRALVRMLAHYVPLFVRWVWRGDARHSPLVGPDGRTPIVAATRVDVAALPAAPPVRAIASRGCG